MMENKENRNHTPLENKGSHNHTSMGNKENYNHTHLEEPEHSHSHGHLHVHSHEETVKIRNRLARAIGHLESVKKMVEDERDCTEILVQLAAVESALSSAGREILKEHMRCCILEAVKSGNTEETKEEIENLNRIMDRFF